MLHKLNFNLLRVTPCWGFDSPPFRKADLMRLSKSHISLPCSPLKKGKKWSFFLVILLLKKPHDLQSATLDPSLRSG